MQEDASLHPGHQMAEAIHFWFTAAEFSQTIHPYSQNCRMITNINYTVDIETYDSSRIFQWVPHFSDHGVQS